jgi:monovalent cation:H+ antiporter-2, CPA2 family
MDLQATDLTSLALVTSAALACGIFMVWLRQPAVVGYILAGIVLGPTGLGLIKGATHVSAMAELGVLMLLFLIGMQLSLSAFVAVLRIALLCTLLEIILALAVAVGLGSLLGWSPRQALLIGFILSLSSTALAMKMLQDIGELKSEVGRVTVGVLIAQDLAVVPMLILVDSLDSAAALDFRIAAKVSIATGLLVLATWFLNRHEKMVLPFTNWLVGRTELIPLATLAFCFSAATLSGFFGLSPAYGAFLAGLLIANSTSRARAVLVVQPIQSVLLVVFFLAIGLLIDLGYIWAHIGTVLVLLTAVLAIKTFINVAALVLLGQPLGRALRASVVMAQIGEFSFVLAASGFNVGAIDSEGYRLAIAVIALSLLISPLWLVAARRLAMAVESGAVNLTTILPAIPASQRSLVRRVAVALARWIHAALDPRRSHDEAPPDPAPARPTPGPGPEPEPNTGAGARARRLETTDA